MENELVAEHDELNAVKDFDIDSWISDIEPPTIVKTVNTRGDLLGMYGALSEEREQLLQSLQKIAEALPEEDAGDPFETVGADPHAEAREQFEKCRNRMAEIDQQMEELKEKYGANKATFRFSAISPEARARINTEHPDHKREGGVIRVTEQLLKLFLASILSVTITQDGKSSTVDAKKWSVKQLTRFMDRIGEGQAAKLWDAHLELGQKEVTPPFSLESSPGGTLSTF